MGRKKGSRHQESALTPQSDSLQSKAVEGNGSSGVNISHARLKEEADGDLKKQLEALAKENKKLEQLGALKEENKTLKAEKAQLQDQNKALEGKKTELEREKANLESENKTLKGEKAQLQDQNKALEGKKTKLEFNITELKRKITELELKITELEHKITELQDENKALKAEKAKLELDKQNSVKGNNTSSVNKAGMKKDASSNKKTVNASSASTKPSAESSVVSSLVSGAVLPFDYLWTGMKIVGTVAYIPVKQGATIVKDVAVTAKDLAGLQLGAVAFTGKVFAKAAMLPAEAIYERVAQKKSELAPELKSQSEVSETSLKL